MKVPAEKLGGELGRKILPVYLVSGDEPLLVQEATDQVRAALRAAGYTERELFHAEGSFDWEEVLFSANSMSLFAEQKILEIRMPSGKPGDKGAKALKEYAANLPEGTTMILVLPRLDQSSQRSQWFKALESAGVFVQVWPISLAQMPRWLGDRCRKAGLKVDREAIEALIDRVEGNLLAAIQEIERLSLISGDERIGFNQVTEGVADSSRYDVFGLIDAAVGQDRARTLKVVQGLRTEGTEVLYVTSMLARELRLLASMAARVEGGASVDSAVSAGKVWPKRKGIVSKCLKSRRLDEMLALQRQVGHIDRLVKGIGQGDPWDELTDIVLALAGAPPISSPSSGPHRHARA